MKTIIFDLDIYSIKSIIDAIEAYSQIAKIAYAVNDGKCVCIINESQYDVELTACEFQNYVLHCAAIEGELR